MILAVGAVLLILGEILSGPFAKIILLAAFLIVAFDVLVEAVKNIRRGEVFGESFLMTIAGIGAVCIGEIPEGVLVFLLYRLGEYLQDKAVASSRNPFRPFWTYGPTEPIWYKMDRSQKWMLVRWR